MTFLETFFIAIGLAMDCFAVSLGIGTSPLQMTRRRVFRISFHFGLFQGGMTLLGWLAGSSIAALIASFDHWIALLLLVWVGGRMLHAGLSQDREETYPQDPTRGATLVALSIATSIDASAVGLSLAMLNVNIAAAALTIGLTSLALALAGLLLGCQLGRRFGKRMEILGGVILIGIGVRIVLQHVWGMG